MVNIAKFPFPVTACMSFDGLVQFFIFAQMESYRNFSEGYTGYTSALWKPMIRNNTVVEFLHI